MLGTAEVVSHSRKSSGTAYDLMSQSNESLDDESLAMSHSNESSSISTSKEVSGASSGIEFESSCEDAAQTATRPRHQNGIPRSRMTHPAKSRSPATYALQDTVLHSRVIRPPPNRTISANPRQGPSKINSTVNHIHQRLVFML